MARNLIDDETFEFKELSEELQELIADVQAMKTALQQAGTKIERNTLWTGQARQDGTVINLNDDPHNYDYIEVHYGYNGYENTARFSSAQFYSLSGAFIHIADLDKDDEESPFRLEVIEYNIRKNNNDAHTTEYVLWSHRFVWDGQAGSDATQHALGPTTVNSQCVYSIRGIKYTAALSGE